MVERRYSGTRIPSDDTVVQGRRSREASFDKQWESEFGDKGNTILPFLNDIDVLQHDSKEFKQAVGMGGLLDSCRLRISL